MNQIAAVHPAQRPRPAEDLDGYVCWSRMQAEAGQPLEDIVARKETERRAGDGLFLWGVGNAPAVAIPALARLASSVPAVFSIMRSRPKAVDLAPARTFAWRSYVDADGARRPLPDSALVTSRGDAAGGPKRAHYALMCLSREPLAIRRGVSFDAGAYRNVGGAGAPVGASQVTALLRRVEEPSPEAQYEVNLSAWLAGSYWVRLCDAVEVPARLAGRVGEAGRMTERTWLGLAAEFRKGPAVTPAEPVGMLL